MQCTRLPESLFQIQRRSSMAMLTTWLAVRQMLMTVAEWPVSLCWQQPDSKSHTRTLQSLEPLAATLPPYTTDTQPLVNNNHSMPRISHIVTWPLVPHVEYNDEHVLCLCSSEFVRHISRVCGHFLGHCHWLSTVSCSLHFHPHYILSSRETTKSPIISMKTALTAHNNCLFCTMSKLKRGQNSNLF